MSYQECTECDRVFEVSGKIGVTEAQVETHMREVHGMVRLRKGSNYKWARLEELEPRLLSPGGAK